MDRYTHKVLKRTHALNKYIPVIHENDNMKQQTRPGERSKTQRSLFSLPGIGVAGDIGKNGFLNKEGELEKQRRDVY